MKNLRNIGETLTSLESNGHGRCMVNLTLTLELQDWTEGKPIIYYKNTWHWIIWIQGIPRHWYRNTEFATSQKSLKNGMELLPRRTEVAMFTASVLPVPGIPTIITGIRHSLAERWVPPCFPIWVSDKESTILHRKCFWTRYKSFVAIPELILIPCKVTQRVTNHCWSLALNWFCSTFTFISITNLR